MESIMHIEERLPASPAAAATARNIVTAHAPGHMTPERMEDAVAVISELVAGTCTPGREPLLTLDLDGGRLVGILHGAGGDSAVMQEAIPGPSRRIVDTLSDAWGMRPGEDGVDVWFEVSLRSRV
jgi:hypothetical protein